MSIRDEFAASAKALLIHIDAIPPDAVLPAMPGVDRDYVDSTIDHGGVEELIFVIRSLHEYISAIPDDIEMPELDEAKIFEPLVKILIQ